MITPEIDWWIKNVTEVKKPVYNRKRYIFGAGGRVTTTVNQDQNIKLILVTDMLVSRNGALQTLTIKNVAFNENLLLVDVSSNISGAYISNFNYLVEGEYFDFSYNNVAGVHISVGYITISSAT